MADCGVIGDCVLCVFSVMTAFCCIRVVCRIGPIVLVLTDQVILVRCICARRTLAHIHICTLDTLDTLPILNTRDIVDIVDILLTVVTGDNVDILVILNT